MIQEVQEEAEAMDPVGWHFNSIHERTRNTMQLRTWYELIYLQCLFLLIQSTGGRFKSSNSSALAFAAAAAASLALADFFGFFFFFFFWLEDVAGSSSYSFGIGEVSPEEYDGEGVIIWDVPLRCSFWTNFSDMSVEISMITQPCSSRPDRLRKYRPSLQRAL